ncbi:mfs transporter [Moniliophthora roreri MCA 2997]|uniref:Mfs transporter n=1 Tax=Moniliophthora roreri (strain MCA 2997) TaxID=1381753 RepID=V2YUA3_MONRO|nr:mfs transporter [Moniliophthora roreri MCA 2997]
MTDRADSIAEKSSGNFSLPLIDPEKENRLRRKLDLIVLPIATLCYALNFLDRGNIGNARSAGLVTDLGLHTYDFNIGTSLYYVTYLIFEIPLALLIKRVGFIVVPISSAVFFLSIDKRLMAYSSILMFGLVTLGTAFIDGRGGFYATRVLLGLTEAASMPGISYLLTRYYRRNELTSRVGCFMLIAAGSAGGFGGLLAAGLLRVGQIGSRSSWQNIFLIEGIITIAIGLVLIPIFPTDPERTRILNEEERRLAIARMYADQPQIKDTKEGVNRSLVKRGILDVTTLTCVWLYIVDNLSVQGLGIFLPSILKLNYPEASTVRIQLLVVPIYATATIVALLFTIGCIKLRMHWPFSVTGGLMTIVGYSIWISTDSTAKQSRYAACFLNLTGGFINGPVVLGWAASNASPDTIRAMVGAVVSGLGGIGSIAGIWAYIQTDAPTGYHKGNSFNLAMASSLCVGALGLLFYQRRENWKRDLGARDYRLQQENVEQLGNLHPSFRYIY